MLSMMNISSVEQGTNIHGVCPLTWKSPAATPPVLQPLHGALSFRASTWRNVAAFEHQSVAPTIICAAAGNSFNLDQFPFSKFRYCWRLHEVKLVPRNRAIPSSLTSYRSLRGVQESHAQNLSPCLSPMKLSRRLTPGTKRVHIGSPC